jgi:hypothetical protein
METTTAVALILAVVSRPRVTPGQAAHRTAPSESELCPAQEPR